MQSRQRMITVCRTRSSSGRQISTAWSGAMVVIKVNTPARWTIRTHKNIFQTYFFLEILPNVKECVATVCWGKTCWKMSKNQTASTTTQFLMISGKGWEQSICSWLSNLSDVRSLQVVDGLTSDQPGCNLHPAFLELQPKPVGAPTSGPKSPQTHTNSNPSPSSRTRIETTSVQWPF